MLKAAIRNLAGFEAILQNAIKGRVRISQPAFRYRHFPQEAPSRCRQWTELSSPGPLALMMQISLLSAALQDGIIIQKPM
jgi:hypothetical protein